MDIDEKVFRKIIADDFKLMRKMLNDYEAELAKHPVLECIEHYKFLKGCMFEALMDTMEIKHKREDDGEAFLKKI